MYVWAFCVIFVGQTEIPIELFFIHWSPRCKNVTPWLETTSTLETLVVHTNPLKRPSHGKADKNIRFARIGR